MLHCNFIWLLTRMKYVLLKPFFKKKISAKLLTLLPVRFVRPSFATVGKNNFEYLIFAQITLQHPIFKHILVSTRHWCPLRDRCTMSSPSGKKAARNRAVAATLRPNLVTAGGVKEPVCLPAPLNSTVFSTCNENTTLYELQSSLTIYSNGSG